MNLHKTQNEILNFMRGKNSSLSEALQEDLLIYKSLIINNAQALIEKIYPYTCTIVRRHFDVYDLVKSYLEELPSSSPIYSDLLNELPIFISNYKDLLPNPLPNYLSELAYYELSILQVQNFPDLALMKNGFNPHCKFLDLQFPISKVIELIKVDLETIVDVDIEIETEKLFVYREPETFLAKTILVTQVLDLILLNLSQEMEITKLSKLVLEKFPDLDQKSFDELILSLKNLKVLLN